MKKTKIFALIAVLLASLILCSCSEYSKSGYEFDPGKTVSPEELESIYGQTEKPISTSKEQSKDSDAPIDSVTTALEETVETSAEQTTVIVIDENTVLYWTKSGTKYHIFRDCQSLKNSTSVESGTLAKANENKKTECCKHCENRAGLGENE